MTKHDLERVHDALTDLIDDINDAAADDDRGRSNDALCLTLFDDGSGSIGRRKDYDGPYGRVTDVDDWHQFGDLDGLVDVLKGMNVEFDGEGSGDV